MRTNLENPRIYEPRLSGIRHANVVVVLTATQIIPSDGPTVWILDGGLSDRSVRLPVLASDKQVVVANVGATNNLNVTDSGGGALATLPPLAMSIFFAGTSRWVWITDNFASDIIPATVITASGAVATTDVNVQVNGAGAVVLALPASATWLAASGWRGNPLTIFDISGAAATNNVTINPSVGQTINGFASRTINTNYGGFRLMPKSTGGGWIIV